MCFECQATTRYKYITNYHTLIDKIIDDNNTHHLRYDFRQPESTISLTSSGIPEASSPGSVLPERSPVLF